MEETAHQHTQPCNLPKALFTEKLFFINAKDILKFLELSLLALLTLVSTTVAVMLITASFEKNWELSRRSLYREQKLNELNSTIQAKLNYLLEDQPVK